MPRVSVLMASYMPPRRFLVESLESLDAQIYRDFEVIIVDESDAETAAFLSSMRTNFPIRIVRPARRLGFAGSLNLGLENCSGELIARHDTDDICVPNRLEAQVAFLDQHPEICAVGAAIMKIGPDGEYLGTRRYPATPVGVRRLSGLWCPVAHPTMMLRRSFFERYGNYNSQPMEDYELWLRALAAGAKIANLDQVLLKYRIEAKTIHSQPRHWGEGLRLRWRHLNWEFLPTRLLGIALTSIAAVTPPSVFKHIYNLSNRLR